jgi:hypothetical protein
MMRKGTMNSLIPTYCPISSSDKKRRIGSPVSSLAKRRILLPSARSFADAQDDKRVLSILATFWLTLAGLLNKCIGVSGNELCPAISNRASPRKMYSCFQTNLATTEENVIMSSEHSFLTMKEDMQLFVHSEYFCHANTTTRA